MTIRPYQADCISAFESGWSEFQRQLGVLPTGSGKTIIFSRMTRDAVDSGRRTLVLVDQAELAFQTVEKMKLSAGLDCAVEKAEFTAAKSSMTVCATVQTMSRRLDEWPANHFGFIICDEADKSLAPTWQSILKHFTADRVAGFTATPNRADKRNLGEYYQKVAYQIKLTELIKQGYLSQIVVKQLPIRIDLRAVKVKQGDYDVHQLDDAITPHLKEAAAAIINHASFRKTLVFVPLIATSQKMVKICNEIGIAAEHIDGTSEDRNEKLKRFSKGEFDVLVNSCLLLRGVDIPTIDSVFMLRPTQSNTLYQQAIGRGTRLAEGKENLLILDPFFEADKRLICRPANLIAESQAEADSINEASGLATPPPGTGTGGPLTAFDLLGAASEAQALRERRLREKLDEHADKAARFISAEDFAIRAGKMDVAEYEPTMKWESEPATAKQIKYLEQAGIAIDTVRGKGHASQLLSIHFGSKPLDMAGPAAVSLMCKMRHISAAIGITNPEHATAREAGRFFAELNKRKKNKVAGIVRDTT